MRVAKALSSLDHVVVSAHVNPDGDALGSAIASILILKALGKQVAFYSSTGIPDFLQFMPLPCKLHRSLDTIPFTPESAFLVDCGEFHRIGGDLETAVQGLARVNVDHHEGQGMGTIATWVEPQAAAAAQLMAYLALCVDIPLEGDLARAVALGVVTDTGGFSFGNTSADVFDLCSLLVRNGLDISRLRQEIDNTLRPQQVRLWGQLSDRIELLCGGRLAFCRADRALLAKCGAVRDDLEGFVEYLRRIRGVRVSCLVREEEDARCKFSLRSLQGVDVWSIAKTMNGGGHKNAAGGTLFCSLDEAAEQLKKALLASDF
ncbi:MAG: DHH family phosphoesterase [Desulfovibrio sp.]|nr:DHH family phosphoesterase [Desulfovibrio sp.]